LKVVFVSEFPMVVDLSVSNKGEFILVFMMVEGLLSSFCKVVDGKSMEAEDGRGIKMDYRVIRTTRLQSFKADDLFRS
jgi:hypothetical protein